MKILIVGKNGYISRCFQEYMSNFSDQITVISARKNEWETFSFSGYDAVFNTIGLAHNDARMGTTEEFMRLNVELPVKLGKQRKRGFLFLFI